jgi:hypothetical protein
MADNNNNSNAALTQRIHPKNQWFLADSRCPPFYIRAAKTPAARIARMLAAGVARPAPLVTAVLEADGEVYEAVPLVGFAVVDRPELGQMVVVSLSVRVVGLGVVATDEEMVEVAGALEVSDTREPLAL